MQRAHCAETISYPSNSLTITRLTGNLQNVLKESVEVALTVSSLWPSDFSNDLIWFIFFRLVGAHY